MNTVVVLSLTYLGITFIWSLIEKLSDWSGTLAYYQNHFKQSILEKHVRNAVLLVVILELFCTLSVLYGVYTYISDNNLFWVEFGLISMAITLMVLMIGQRIAKDYPGASTVTIYFLVSLLGLWAL